jgi:hypothetical protein
MHIITDPGTESTPIPTPDPDDPFVQSLTENGTKFVRYLPYGDRDQEPSPTTRINTMDLADRFVLPLADNETRIIPLTLSGRNIDDNRVAFLLFNETLPGPQVTGSDRINASYRNLYLRISVKQGFFSG